MSVGTWRGRVFVGGRPGSGCQGAPPGICGRAGGAGLVVSPAEKLKKTFFKNPLDKKSLERYTVDTNQLEVQYESKRNRQSHHGEAGRE